ncbi:2,4-dichlorophenol 6-monooxygenase [Coleophoma cylindrospora]|uniref:2,4-dichlorophenol 6-monooxygenase n=1 Tax=Coleophoma cylindrospora TaxID=1849047 RepID=A0A3D8Q9X2_9HELO|nr:2,4-dichlorophenol 6-monooxygenase [Coleophoma cylindrospora]
MGSIAEENVLDVLIVGGGPVGLALALDLGRRGIRSTVIERAAGTGTVLLAKASVINERTMEYCRLLGIRDEVANSGYPDDLSGDTVYCTALNGKYIGRLEMESAQDRDLPAQSSEILRRCPQFLFDTIFARAVVRQGMTDLRYGAELVAIEQDEAGVTCSVKHFESGKEVKIQARYVAACDGPASLVRKALDIPFEGRNLGYAISAIVRVDMAKYQGFNRMAERFMFISPEGTWGNFTTIDGKLLWRFSVVGGQERTDLTTLDMDVLLRKAFGHDDVEYEILRVDQWRRSQFTAERYWKGRIFLAGDSAHTMSPTGGHGLNTGLGDVSDLSWILQATLNGWGGPGLFKAYNTERRPIAIRNGTGSTKNYAIWTEKQGRDKVLEDGPEADEQRRILGESMAASMRPEFQAVGLSLGYDYASSPIVVPDGSSAPLNEPDIYIQTARPGHRAPHYWLKDGKSTIDLYGGGFVLLSFSTENPKYQRMIDAAKEVRLPLECITIPEPELVKLYKNRMVLVRPDGMVAWRGDSLPDDVETLLDHVRGVLMVVNGK